MKHIIPISEYNKTSNIHDFIGEIEDISYILKDENISVISNVKNDILNIEFLDMNPFNSTIRNDFKKSEEMNEFVDRLNSLCVDNGYKILNKFIINNSIKICSKNDFNKIYPKSWDRLINNIHKYGSLIEKDGLKFNINIHEDSRRTGKGEIRYSFYCDDNILSKMSYSKGLRKFEQKVQPICDKLGFVLVIPRAVPNFSTPHSSGSISNAKPDDDLISSSFFIIYRKEYWNEIINNRDSRNVFLINYKKYVDRLPGYIERWGPYQRGQEGIARIEFDNRR